MASGYAARQGDFESARKYASEILEIGKRLKTSHLTTTGYFALANVAMAQGEWETARRLTTDGLEIDANESRLLMSRSDVEFLTGEFEKGGEFLERSARTARASSGSGAAGHLNFANAASVAAVVSGQPGLEKEAVAFCRAAIANPHRELVAKRLAAVALGRFAMASGDLALAQESLDFFARGNLRLTGVWPMPYSGHHVVAALTALTGDVETAIEQLSGEADRFRKIGARPVLAYVLFDLADTLVKRDGQGDVAVASKANDEALAIARDLGMKPLTERILRRREILRA